MSGAMNTETNNNDAEGFISSAIDGAAPVPAPDDAADKFFYKEAAERRRRECPVKPLGVVDRMYYYLCPTGEVSALSGGKHSKLEILSLFGAKKDYLWSEWPRKAGKDENEITVGWNNQLVAEWLIAEASRAGFFNLEKTVRGAGVWRTPCNRLIAHNGNRLLVPTDLAPEGHKTFQRSKNGEYVEIAAGCSIDKKIYAASPSETPPDIDAPALASIAQEMLEYLKSWNWRQGESAPYLWLGFLASAMVSGALKWRSHVHVSGNSGSGKSTLERLLTGIFNHDGILHASDPSAAGLRQLMKGAARPVILDEVEPTADNKRADQVMELARLASTEGQGAVARGSSDGKAQSWPVRGSFYLTSILYPTPKPQDRTRITFLELDSLVENKGGPDLSERTAYFEKHGAALRGRMFLGWERLQQNIMVFSTALASCYSGMPTAARAVDQLATLFAAAETLLYDEPITGAAAMGLIEDLGFGEIAAVDIEHDHDECLNKLLSSSLDVFRHGRVLTVADLLRRAQQTMSEGADTRDALRSCGLLVYPYNDSYTHIRIANNHARLEEIFNDTRWRGGVWSQAFKRLPDAAIGATPASFGGPKSRYVQIPKHLCSIPEHVKDGG